MLEQLILTPGIFLRRLEFMIIYGISIIVYFTSLSTTTVFLQLGIQPGIGSLIIISGVSITMALMKDAKIARICNPDEKQKNSEFPLISFLFFALRDLIVLFFSFYVPPVFTAYMVAKYNVNILLINIIG